MTTLSPERTNSDFAALAKDAAARLDWLLLLIVAGITTMSVFVIRASTQEEIAGDPDFFFTRQILFVVIGVVAMLAVSLIDLNRLARWHWVLWGGLLASLAIVFVASQAVRGTSRWIDIGPFSLQPSEFGKVVLMIVLAGLVVESASRVGTVRFTLLAAGVAGLPAVVVFLQPDLGTAIVYAVILLTILFIAGTPWTHFAVIGAAVGATVTVILWALPASGVEVLQPYQVDRLTAFVSTDPDPGSTGYQLEQSTTAIGSGGALGKGPSGASQTINDFLPEHQTDFIFAVTSEMFGFVGAGGVLVLFGLLLWRGLRITANASTRMDQLVASAIVAVIAFEVFVNIGMTVGLMPITGIPLPFMSYGGSHTVTMLAAVGILLGINARRTSRTR
jgi:rod shape determining protein RodA